MSRQKSIRTDSRRRVSLVVVSVLATAMMSLVVMASTASAAPPSASAWGRGTSGQLGNGFEYTSNIPVAVTGLSGVEAVSVGAFDSMALLENGTVEAWGANSFGQLGNGTTTPSNVPVSVSGLSNVTVIASGIAHNLALLEDGTVKAWGYNEHGQLGNNTTVDSDVPVTVGGLSGVIAISAYENESLALLSDGTVKVWGQGALGNGSIGTSKVPVTVSGLSHVKAIAAGDFFNLALLENGTVMGWGTNSKGDVGDGSVEERLTPVAVCAVGESAGCPNHLEDVSAIAAGGRHALALREDGTVVAWGFNSFGALGDGSTTERRVPVVVSGLANVKAISIGDYHGMALLENGTVMAWGWNGEGRLGNPDAGEESHVPVAVSGLTEGVAIAAGSSHSLAAGAAPPPLPQIAQVSPNFGGGGGGTSVSISGVNFSEASVVKFGSADATNFTLNSPTSITATAPPGTGTVDIKVTTPVGTSPENNQDTFRYSPTIESIAPKFGYPAGGTPVTIAGTNFSEVIAVKFGSTNAASYTVDSTSQITAVSPTGSGIVDVVVETQGGSSPTRELDHFTYNATPVIESVTPNHGPPSGETDIAIKGSNFTGATAVKFGTQAAASFTVQSTTEITATTPAFGGGGDGVAPIFVTTSNGTNGFYGCGTEERAFIYDPTITSIEPSSGPTTGGTEVTIHGVGFESVIWGEEPLCSLAFPVLQGVRFGSEPAESVDHISGTEMTAVAPPGSGTVHITLRYPWGMGSPTSASDRFTYSWSSADPVIEGESVSGLSGTNATLEAEIDTHGVSSGAFYQFQLLRDPGEASEELECPSSPPSGFSVCIGPSNPSALPMKWIAADETKTVKLDLSSAGVSLENGQTYFFRLLAAKQVFTEDAAEWEPPAVVGATKEFTTPTPPAILNESATEIDQKTFKVAATVSPNSSNITDCKVEYGVTLNYGSSQACSFPSGNGPDLIDVNALLADLAASSVYHYRVVATNPGGTTEGSDHTFTTTHLPTCTFGGSGTCGGSNPTNPKPKPRKCKKGFVKKHGKCVRRHPRHRHHNHRKHHKRR